MEFVEFELLGAEFLAGGEVGEAGLGGLEGVPGVVVLFAEGVGVGELVEDFELVGGF